MHARIHINLQTFSGVGTILGLGCVKLNGLDSSIGKHKQEINM